MSQRRSFFGQVTRYTGGGLRQEENTLTESFAATLNAAQVATARVAEILVSTNAHEYSQSFGERPGRTEEVAAFLNDLDGTPEIKASTQWVIPTIGIPDLVLSISDGVATKRIAVEVKIAADLTGQQLKQYVERGHFDAVVLLAPRKKLREIGKKLEEEGDEYRTRVALRAWETIGRELGGVDVEDPVEFWIVEQFIDYLREEGLMAPKRLDKKHLEALALAGPARDALVELLHEVNSSPSLDVWSQGANTKIEKEGVGSRIHWLLPEWRRRQFPEGTEPWLQLSVESSPQEGLFFTAGLCTSDQARMRDFVRTMDAERDGLGAFDEGRDYRLGRIERAESLFEGKARLDDQAAALAEWVRESFELVAPLQPAK